MKILFAILLLVMTVHHGMAESEKGLFENPIEFFSGALLPSLSNSEAAKIITTHRGFYIRADSHPGLQDEYDPSELGIYLDVSVRDPEEILVFKDSTTTRGLITTRTVELPAPKNEQVALRITLVYGKSAPEKALAAIRASIAGTIKTSEQAGAGQPATRPESKSEGSDKPQPEAKGRSR